MLNVPESLHRPADLCADFCGELEGYVVTGEATNELDRLCGKLWNSLISCRKWHATMHKSRSARPTPARRKPYGARSGGR
jgi:hypothetical protein